MEEIAEIIRRIAVFLCDSPEQVSVSYVCGDGTAAVFSVRAAPDDVGRLIGHRGHFVTALRTVAKAMGYRVDKRVMVDVVEPGRSSEKDRSLHRKAETPVEEAAPKRSRALHQRAT